MTTFDIYGSTTDNGQYVHIIAVGRVAIDNNGIQVGANAAESTWISSGGGYRRLTVETLESR